MEGLCHLSKMGSLSVDLKTVGCLHICIANLVPFLKILKEDIGEKEFFKKIM